MPEQNVGLSENASLRELQRFVQAFETKHGFERHGLFEECLLLGEEVGELFKAVRQCSGIGIADDSQSRQVASEVADVLLLLCAVANRANVDLENALREKLRINGWRTWR